MKKSIGLACATALLAVPAFGGDAEPTAIRKVPPVRIQGEGQKQEQKGYQVMTDYEVAQSKAKLENKPILLIFSGSDWCGWCVKLDKEVFSQKAFQDWAKDNVIVYIADFPRAKQLPLAVSKQNEILGDKYKIRGFPTVLLLNADGKILAQTGYRPGGPEKYVDYLKSLMPKK